MTNAILILRRLRSAANAPEPVAPAVLIKGNKHGAHNTII